MKAAFQGPGQGFCQALLGFERLARSNSSAGRTPKASHVTLGSTLALLFFFGLHSGSLRFLLVAVDVVEDMFWGDVWVVSEMTSLYFFPVILFLFFEQI